MSVSNDESAGTPKPPKPSTVILLLGTIADTTWRMFVPIIGFMLLGLWIDKSFGTLPLGLVSLLLVGIAIAAELIRRQLRNVNKT